MIKHKVWRSVLKSQIPMSSKILDMVWSMKKQGDGTLWSRFTAHGCSQEAGEYYDSSLILALIPNDAPIHIFLTLMLMAHGRI